MEAVPEDAPAVPALPKERMIIAQELATAVKGKDKGAVGAALANIFLVLPDLSERSGVVVRLGACACEREAERFLSCSSRWRVRRWGPMKVGKGASGIATKIDPDNPNAVPIYIAGMKKKFETRPIHGTRTSGLRTLRSTMASYLCRPLRRCMAFQLLASMASACRLRRRVMVCRHVLWPFIASALNYNGTKGRAFSCAISPC